MKERKQRWDRVRVDFCRRTAGTPVPQVAGSVGAHRATVYRWLHGRQVPLPQHLDRIERLVREEEERWDSEPRSTLTAR